MKVLFCGSGWFEVLDYFRARLPASVTLTTWDRKVPLIEAVSDADVILPSNAQLDRNVVHAARRLVLLQQPAVGTEAIDLDAARSRNIPVCNAPGTNTSSVAEAALLLLLALARRLPLARAAFESKTIGSPVGMELRGRTLLIVGMGKSGSQVAHVAEALGMRVLGARSATSRSDLLAMCTQADAVSVHCPVTAKTRGMIDAEFLAALPRGALLVNVSRGPILERAAVEVALTSGALSGLGLDVFWQEPWDPTDPLFQRDDVVTLPHVGGSTHEAFGRIADIVAENIRRVVAGEPLLHRIA